MTSRKPNILIDEKIKRIKPFFEQVAIFFLLLVVFLIFDSLLVISIFWKFIIIIIFSAWAFSLLLQELYVYKILKPFILGKRWDRLVKRGRP